MIYDIKIYEPALTNINFRFSLGTAGKTPLFVIGLNPSVATNTESDRTITKIINFANNHGFDSFIMLNLYAQRATNPQQLDLSVNTNLHMQNVNCIFKHLEKQEKVYILAAWGEGINLRKYLKECLFDIYNVIKNKNIIWLKIGELTQSGDPRHPSRASYIALTEFNIENYLMK